jgi:hypothetical protein
MRHRILTVLPVLLIVVLLALPGSLFAQVWNFRNGFGTNLAGQERGLASAADAAGNVYVAGIYVGPINFGTGPLPANGANEGFVAKFSPAGVCLWAVGFSATSGNDVATAVAVDAAGTSVYVGGSFNGDITIAPLPTVTKTGITGFIAKLNAANGQGIWVNTIDGTGSETVQSLCLDGTGNVYASGTFPSGAIFGALGAKTANGGTSTDLFVAQLNPASGAFNWVSTGGALNQTDNGTGSGITYVAALNEIVLTGSYNSAAATYATTSPVSSFTIPNAGSLDICFLELNATTGAFVNAIGVGGTLQDDGVAVVYDPSTGDVMACGEYASATLQFGSNPVITNEGNLDSWYLRFNPATDAFVWSKGAGGSTSGADRAYDITTNGVGAIYVVGVFRGVFDIPTTLPAFTLTNNNTADDIFLARINAADGNGQLLAQGAGPAGNTVSNVGFTVTAGATGNIWVSGSYGNNITLAPLPVLPLVGTGGVGLADVLLAKYTDPAPLTATQSQTDVTCNVGCNGTATVTPSGGVAPYTYTWTPNVSTTGTAGGFCVGATPSVIVKDAIGNTVSKNYTITMPATSLATTNTTNTTFVVSASNTNIYDATCKLIATVVPNGASPVSGTVSARVWFEAGVPVYPAVTGTPYVARHYEIQPATGAATATARVTLYFTQAEFTAFNAAPKTTLDLPTGPGDAAGKANVRIGKYPGASNNPATGLPNTYTSGGKVVLDPVDADVVWNATLSRWEISINIVGFSGFFLQTSYALLPVTWVSVNGSLNHQGQPVISWKVEETDVASYSIEKSADGQAYTSIATINSKGDGKNEYSFQELQALSGKANYRIKQTDHNGRVTYSKVLLLKSDRKGWVTLYPNPVKKSATLNVTDKELLNTTARLYDGTGREVQRIQITQSVTTIHMDQLNAGVYTLKLKDGQTIRILKE